MKSRTGLRREINPKLTLPLLRLSALSLLLVLCLSGCAGFRGVTVYPIKDTDMILIDKGSKITDADTGQEVIVPSNGYYLSDFYFQEVLDASIKK